MQIRNFRDKIKNLVLPTLIACLLGCLFFLAYYSKTNTSIAQAAKGVDNIKVFNNIDKLQIINSKAEDDRFIVNVKNNFDKPINSFYLTAGDITYNIELIYSDVRDSVDPASDYQLSTDLDKNLYSSGLTVRAVLFEDGTGAGEARFIKEMKDKRYGEKVQFTRGKYLLENFLSSLGSGSPAKLTELKEKTSSLPLTDENTQNESVKFGMDLGKQRLMAYVQELSRVVEGNKLGDLEPETTKIKNKLEKYISKLK
jgi:hypothetical protein